MNRLSGLFHKDLNLVVGWAGEPAHERLIDNAAIG
jgi:hypothetical protein